MVTSRHSPRLFASPRVLALCLRQSSSVSLWFSWSRMPPSSNGTQPTGYALAALFVSPREKALLAFFLVTQASLSK